MKNKNGITLIALIITIIILLILAMVTINILINQGIIGHAQNAVETYDEKQVKEDIALSYDEYKMQKFGANAKSLYDFFKDKYGADHVTDNGDGSITVSVTSNGKTYTVKLKEDGSMESMSGLSLDKSSITLEYEDGTPATDTITATLTDISGDVRWSIADNSIATISAATGNQITVTSVKSGTTTIIATCGKYTKTCEVKVYMKLPIGEYINYKCYSTVADADKSKLYYKSPKEKTGRPSDQEYEVTTDIDWMILGRDSNGNILITSADPVSALFLSYTKTGYINGIDEINNVAEIYGYGEHALNARSITEEDVRNTTGQKATKQKYTYTLGEDGYIYTNKNIAPSEYTTFTYPGGDEKTDWEWLSNSNKTVTLYGTTQQYNEYQNGNYKMFSEYRNGSNASYWLASRSVRLENGFALYCIQSISSVSTNGINLYNSYERENKNAASGTKVRPVVTLDITELAGKDDDGVWQIE